MHVRLYVNLKLNDTNMDPSPAKELLKNIQNYSFQNTEMFFSFYSVQLRNVLLTVYNFRIVYKNGDFKEFP